MKICRVGAKLFHADRQTDMTKVIVALRNFVNLPKNVEIFHIFILVNNTKAIC